MQRNEVNKLKGEISTLFDNEVEIESKLASVIKHFNIPKHLKAFDELKNKGYALSELLHCMLLIPFYGASNVYGFVRMNHRGIEKDSYYNAKNNEHIDWRSLLYLMAQRFIYLTGSKSSTQSKGITALVGDDSPMHKTGKKMERVGMIHDHVTNTFVLGYKLLVIGFYDGCNFFPINFSLHREKGTRLNKAASALKKAEKAVQTAEAKLQKASQSLERKQQIVDRNTKAAQANPTNTNLKRLNTSYLSEAKMHEKIKRIQGEVVVKKAQVESLKQNYKKVQKKHPAYGLSRKQKQAQFKKERSFDSFGKQRIKETDKSKTDMFIVMLKDAVKRGFIPNYVLTDTWFFSKNLLEEIAQMKDLGIYLLSMARMGNTKYTVATTGKEMTIHGILASVQCHVKYNRKLKAFYLRVPAFYGGMRVNLFLVKLGNNGKWRLLVTNDLDMNFNKLMEVYQLRWSIEVFFKECKQYLNLGKSQSSDFDGQIADTTIAMIQYIMLTFFKRINQQQSFSDLFKNISDEMVEVALAETLWELFIKVMRIFGELFNIDASDIYEQIMRKPEAMELAKEMIFSKRCLNVAA